MLGGWLSIRYVGLLELARLHAKLPFAGQLRERGWVPPRSLRSSTQPCMYGLVPSGEQAVALDSVEGLAEQLDASTVLAPRNTFLLAQQEDAVLQGLASTAAAAAAHPNFTPCHELRLRFNIGGWPLLPLRHHSVLDGCTAECQPGAHVQRFAHTLCTCAPLWGDCATVCRLPNVL